MKKIKMIIGLTGILSVIAIPTVAKDVTKLGMSLVVGLIAISIACIALLSKRKRNLDKQYYLDYLIL